MPRKPGPGRKRLGGSRVAVRLSDAQHAALQTAAIAARVDLSTFVREMALRGAGMAQLSEHAWLAEGRQMEAIVKAAEDSVAVYLDEVGVPCRFDDGWFTESWEMDSANKPWPNGSWATYRDAAKAALLRAHAADGPDPRLDGFWRSVAA